MEVYDIWPRPQKSVELWLREFGKDKGWEKEENRTKWWREYSELDLPRKFVTIKR